MFQQRKFVGTMENNLRIHLNLESCRDIMQGAMESYSSQVSNRMLGFDEIDVGDFVMLLVVGRQEILLIRLRQGVQVSRSK